MSTISANTITSTNVVIDTLSANTVSANTIAVSTITANVAVPSSGKIGFGSDDVTIVHSTNKLDIDGGVVDFGSAPTVNGASVGITLGSLQATTSGTTIDFSSIPSWVKKITVLFDGVSTNGASAVTVQIGTGGVPTTSGYSGSSTIHDTSSSVAQHTTGFAIRSLNAADVRTGIMTIINLTGNRWIMSYVGTLENAVRVCYSCGTVTLGGTLNFLRITAENGTDVFDLGQAAIYYE